MESGDLFMSQLLPFREVLEAADHLSEEEQEELVAILHRRLAQAARRRLAGEVKEARQEFAEGRCSPATPDELMGEILK
jgi:ribosomal protein S4